MNTDFLVVGAGVVGLSIALELKRRRPDCSVTVLEKEGRPGLHASGRNSGVLHAGFYYTADSLKARFTRDGCREMRAFCEGHGLKVNGCGKLVVARNESELEGLAELMRRAVANGVELHELSEKQAREIEPRVKTHEKALWSPTTATVDPSEVMAALARDAEHAGIAIECDTAYVKHVDGWVRTSRDTISAGYVVNAAGLYADRVARDFEFGEDYRVLPFKGIYLYSDEPAGSLRTNVYPVPNLKNPFLGVHFTVTADGHAKIGPTAIPCLWREQYGWLGGFRGRELWEGACVALPLFLRAGFDFRSLAFQEVRKYWKRHLVRQAGELVSGMSVRNYRRWGKPGIRAQLVDVKSRKLVMDFCLQGDRRSMHVLNAVSPAFTCSAPFARRVCDEIERVGG